MESTKKENDEVVKNSGTKNEKSSLQQQQETITNRVFRWKKRMRYQPQNVGFKKKKEGIIPRCQVQYICLTLRHEYHKDLVNSESQSKVELPRAISVADRVEASAKEMKAMLQAVSQHTSDRSVLQKIPRHMRRRAASHNRKRLPRRLHQMAAEMSAQSQEYQFGKLQQVTDKVFDLTMNEPADGKVAKPANRKKRRRKRDLQNEFCKRAGKHGWLETHMWHAKRFHMSESTDPRFKYWGNRVALFPNDKSFRACYRAVAKHCLIQDLSYMRCLHLSGSHDILLTLLSSISADGTEFDEIVFDGQREKEIILYNIASAGKLRECIGPATILWRPQIEGTRREVQLWIHPTILTLTSNLLSTFCRENNLDITTSDISDKVLRFRLTGPKSSVSLLSVLRPLNHHPCSSQIDEDALKKWMIDNAELIPQLHSDFIAVMTDCHRKIYAKPDSKVPMTSTVPEYADGSVFPVITNDPRLTLPLNKTTPTLTDAKKNLFEAEEEQGYSTEKVTLQEYTDSITVPEDFVATQCRSPLWEDNIRDQISKSRIPDHIVSTRRRQQKFERNEKVAPINTYFSAVPVIIIRKSPNEGRDLKDTTQDTAKKRQGGHSGPNRDFASGWDIVLPSGWGTAFWIPFVYHRVRAGALRENHNTSLECLSPHFPEDYPDTESGKYHWNCEANKLANKYYRKPPAKRPNYSVLAVPNPFQPDWSSLFNIKSVQSCEIIEESGKKILKRSADNKDCEKEIPEKKLKIEDNDINGGIVKSGKFKTTQSCPEPLSDNNDFTDSCADAGDYFSKLSVIRDIKRIALIQNWILDKISNKSTSESHMNFLNSTFNQLVCVSVKTLNKGIPSSRSMLCQPTFDDIDNLCDDLIDPYKYGLQSVVGPCEQNHWDPYRKERKEARKEAKKRKKNKQSKEKPLVISEDVTKSVIESSDPPKTQSSIKQPQTFPVSPSRETIGYVTSGDFLFSHACGAGIGFVSIKKLLSLVLEQVRHEKLNKILNDECSKKALLNSDSNVPVLALMRNTDTVQYRFVKLEIIKPW